MPGAIEPATTTTTTATPPSNTTTTSTTTPRSCPPEYQLYPGYNCYKAFPSRDEHKTWSEARQQCIRDRGDLMVLDSEREREDVYIPLYNSVSWESYLYPWVGVHIPQAGNEWTTVNGLPVLSTWWNPAYPKKNAALKYAQADYTGLLRNINDCTATMPFICEISL